MNENDPQINQKHFLIKLLAPVNRKPGLLIDCIFYITVKTDNNHSSVIIVFND